jgi:hypothetical protein
VSSDKFSNSKIRVFSLEATPRTGFFRDAAPRASQNRSCVCAVKPLSRALLREI